MRRIAFSALVSIPLMLAACTPETPEEAEESAAAEELAQAEEEQSQVVLDLQANGIIVPAQNGFEELAAPFGSPQAATELTLANALGEIVEQGTQPNDCGLTYSRYEGLTLNFSDGEFVGYWAEEPYVPNLDRSEMLEDPSVALLEDTTLNGEFTIGEREGAMISGIFEGEEDGAAVRALWAGENCIAR